MNLHDYSHIIINTSGGKDSIVAISEIHREATLQGYPKENIFLSHQDLGQSEWPGTTELVRQQAAFFGYPLHITRRRNKAGHQETLLEYVERRRKWPSSSTRYCTSDFKRGPGARVVTQLTKGFTSSSVLYVFGFRAEESTARKKKPVLELNKRLTTKKRTVHNYLPVHNWTTAQVWDRIKTEGIPYHKAYDLGMPRLSCVFCVMADFNSLVIAGRHNSELLQQHVDLEVSIGHTFKNDFSLLDVQEAIAEGYVAPAEETQQLACCNNY